MRHKIKKNFWINIKGFQIGKQSEIETEDLEEVAAFLDSTWLIWSIWKFANLLGYGQKIERNTLERIQDAWKTIKQRGDNIIEIPMKTGYAILESCWLEDDDDLKKLWSNLLANAATGKEVVHAFYPQILKELTSIDVNVLNLILTDSWYAFKKNEWVSKNKIMQKLDINEEVYDISTDNLQRLRLINTGEGADEDSKDHSYVVHYHKKWLISFTQLWFSFVKACQ